MIHKILLWICGIASILGIILYIIDKTTQKEFSTKLTFSLILGGLLVAIILALTEPETNSPLAEADSKEVNTNQIINNENSPVANKIETQTNNYFDSTPKEKVKFESYLELIKGGKCCLFVNAKMVNMSDISGTIPNIQIHLYGIKMDGGLIEFINYKDFDKWDECGSHTFYSIFTENKIPFSCHICSNSNFSEKVLYPKDYLSLFGQSKRIPNIKNLKYVIGHLESKIKESAPQKKFYLYKFGEGNKLEVVMETDNKNLNKLVEAYLHYTKNDHFQ